MMPSTRTVYFLLVEVVTAGAVVAMGWLILRTRRRLLTGTFTKGTRYTLWLNILMFGLAVGFGFGLVLVDVNGVFVALGGNTSTLPWFAVVVQWTMGVPLMFGSGPWLYLVGLQERYYRPASIVDTPDEQKVLLENIGHNEDKTTT